MENKLTQDKQRLRDKAEAKAKAKRAAPSVAGMKTDDINLLYELQVHQIELEMQNEQLQQAQAALETSRDQYVELYEFAPIAYVCLSMNGIIDRINLTATAMLGVEQKN